MVHEPHAIRAPRSILLPFGLAALGLLLLAALIYFLFVPKGNAQAGSTKSSAIATAATDSPTPAETPTVQLEQIAQRDTATIESKLINSWVPQVASAPIAAAADPDTLMKHIELQNSYGALLLNSNAFATYGDLKTAYWVTVIPLPFDSESRVSDWCADSGRGNDGCRPTYLTHN